MKPNRSLSIFAYSLAALAITAGITPALGGGTGYQLVKPKSYKGKSTSNVAAGKALFEKNNCQNCHSISEKGGCLAPPLDGIGAYRGRPYIIARITLGDKFIKDFARRYKDEELMPHPRLPLKESTVIADYLLSLSSPETGYKVYGHSREESSEEKLTNPLPPSDKKLPGDLALSEEGRNKFLQSGCLACHSIGNLGGRLAPNLAGIGSRRTIDSIESRITRAELQPATLDDVKEGSSSGIQHSSVMPSSSLSPEEIHAIAAFLATLTK